MYSIEAPFHKRSTLNLANRFSGIPFSCSSEYRTETTVPTNIAVAESFDFETCVLSVSPGGGTKHEQADATCVDAKNIVTTNNVMSKYLFILLLIKKAVNIALRIEDHQVINLFADADVADRKVQFLRYCDSDATFGRAV